MGIKDLWHVAGPCEERISLHNLRGQTLAIDLAGWVVQGNAAPGLAYTVTRPHLRNLFFRLNTLLSLDILPVVVLEGSCPIAKSATVEARNQARGLGGGISNSNPSVANSPKRQQRRQFSGVLRDCQTLTLSLGIPCLTAPGEAEAFCSWLNAAGLVDAVISDDSDCFAYGAQTVLRHFAADAKQFSVSRYSARRIREEVGLSRQRMVLMGLILGCDYNLGGVHGVGREALLRLFEMWNPPAQDELDRVMGWEASGDLDSEEDKKPVHCGTCGHPGSVGKHRKGGCDMCGTQVGCVSGSSCWCPYHSEEHQSYLAEVSIKRKATNSPGWPHTQVVKEFYRQPRGLPENKFKWVKPRPAEFISFAGRKMDWLKDYSVEKIIETVVRWQVRHSGLANPLVTPLSVLKTRVKAGENMLEVEWGSAQGSGLPDNIIACVPSQEFMENFSSVYQQYADAQEEKAAKKKKPKKSKEKENKPPKKEKASKRPLKGQINIDKFLQKDLNTENEEKEVVIPKVQEKSDNVNKSPLKPVDIPRPKNIVLKKIVSSDVNFNNKIFEHKLSTPKSAKCDQEELEYDQRKIDSFAYKREIEAVPETAGASCSPFTDVTTESMKEFLDSDDELDLSEVVNNIVGVKKVNQNVLGLVHQISNMSIESPSQLRTPGQKAARSIQTSTPALCLQSKLPTNLHKQVMQKQLKASDVFSITNCSSDEMDEGSMVKTPPRTTTPDESKNDTFDMDTNFVTPFLERVKRRAQDQL